MQKKTPTPFEEALATIAPRSRHFVFEAIGYGLCSGQIPVDLLTAVEEYGMPKEILFDEICEQLDAMPSKQLH